MSISLGEGDEEVAGKSDVDGILRDDWRRCMETGKWPVWKVDLWRRREPLIDFGSTVACEHGREEVGKGKRRELTFWVELQNLQILVSVCDYDIQLLFKGEEFCS